MPFITRNMVRYMKGSASDNCGSKRIRELPYILDPSCTNKIDSNAIDVSNNSNCKHKSYKLSTTSVNVDDKDKKINSINQDSQKPSNSGKNQISSNNKRKNSLTIGSKREKTHRQNSRSDNNLDNKKTNKKSGNGIKTTSSRTNVCKRNDSKIGDILRFESVNILNEDSKKDKKDRKEESGKASHSLGLLAPRENADDNSELYTYTLSVLKSNIKELCETKASENLQHKKYKNFIWSKASPNKDIKPTSCVEVYNAKSRDHPNSLIVCKIYDLKQYDCEESKFLKILQFLRCKHPNIIQTIDIFTDNIREIYVFQKLETCGNMRNFIKNFGIFKEKDALNCASQILRAINYLGVMGISHRSIQPIHILSSLVDGEFIFKLSGFHEAIDYWNSIDQEIFFKHCLPIEDAKTFDFKAPESFGMRNDLFDPVIADIWSYGATIYYSLTESYPFTVYPKNHHICSEIEENVQKLSKVSNNCKEFLSNILNPNSSKRMHFNQMYQVKWLENWGKA